MSLHPLKRRLFTQRPSHLLEATPISDSLKLPSELPAFNLENPSVEEVEALLCEGLGNANERPGEDDVTFLELIDDIVGQSNASIAITPKRSTEHEASVCMDDRETASMLHETSKSPSPTATTKMLVNRHACQETSESSAASKSEGGHGVRSCSNSVSANGVKSRTKCSHLRAGAERLINLMRSGKMPATRVRSAISRSTQRRAEVSERSKRVNDSFLSFDSASAVQVPTHGSHATNSAPINQPEVMRKTPMTGAQRVRRLEQNVVAAKQEWESQYRVLMMVENGAHTHANSDSLDSRHVQHREAVDAAAQKVLEASGDLLLAQVELGMEKLPANQIYYYHDDRARLQGPYKAMQLCKLAKLNVMPSECMVLIDLAQVGGVSVRAPGQALLRLLDDPDNMCHATDTLLQAASPTDTQSRHASYRGMPHLQNLSADSASDPRSGDFGGGCSSAAAWIGISRGHRSCDSGKQQTGGRHRPSETKGLLPETDRWNDSGAKLREANSNGRQRDIVQKNALLAFEEEKELEVYSFEDSEADICGPFSFNELQEKFARGAISEPLLVMYDTDYGTTVLSVAQLFRSMTQRHEEILNAHNPFPPPIETLSSSGHVFRRTDVSKCTLSIGTPCSHRELTDAHGDNCTPSGAYVPVQTSADDPGLPVFTITGITESTGERHSKAACALPTPESLSHSSCAAPHTEANTPDAVENIPRILPNWVTYSSYSAAPPEGYGAAPVTSSGTLNVSALGGRPYLQKTQTAQEGDKCRVQDFGAATLAPSVDTVSGECVSHADTILELPSGFDSFEDLLHHVAENQMEPIKQRMLRTQGSQRPALMARLDFKALRALAEAPVHIADNAIRSFIRLNHEPQDASVEFLRCLTNQDTHNVLC